MTICRYYQQGSCRFGDRCRFEHIDPEYSYEGSNNFSNRRQNQSYQDRYRSQDSYQERSHNHQNLDLSYGPRRYNSYEKPNQSYRSEKYNQYDSHDSYSNRYEYNDGNYHKDSYNNQRYRSPESKASGFGNVQKNNQSYDNSRKQNKNQYEWVSDDYKKQQKKKEQKPYLAPTFQNYDSNGFCVKEPEEFNEDTMFLAERIKEDVTAWELGKQWPFTCYSPFPRKGEFPGFPDVSFEELRYESLKAKENNTFDNFVENISKAIIDVANRRNELKQPSHDLLTLIEKLNAGELLTDSTGTGDLFSFANLTQNASGNIADDILPISASAFSFKTVLDGDAPVQNAASAFSFKTVLDGGAPVQNAASAFSFKTVLDPPASAQSSASTFSFKLPETEKLSMSAFSSKQTSSDTSLYTPVEQLSEQDKEQFSASTFVLGKIPTVPPPRVFCL